MLKSEEEFQLIRDKKSKSGFRLHSWCKKCKSEYEKEYRRTHFHEIQALREVYISNNYEKIREYQKNYREAHRKNKSIV